MRRISFTWEMDADSDDVRISLALKYKLNDLCWTDGVRAQVKGKRVKI